jgi:hypothetical protein
MRNYFFIFFIMVLFVFSIQCAENSDDGGSSGGNSGGEINDHGGQPDTGDIVITDVSTDTDGTSTGSAIFDTGEEITVTGLDEEAVISTKISKSSSMGYNEENYSAIVNYSLKVNPEYEVSVKIKFKETPNAVMAKDNVTGRISYKPFLNNEDGSSHFNMKVSEDVSFFPLKSKSSNQSQNAPSLSSFSENVLHRAIIQKDWKNISITFDASLNVGIAVLDGSIHGAGSTMTEAVVGNTVTFSNLNNGTYVLTAYELGAERAVWVQDIFIENRNVSDYVISALAEKFAPILAMNGEEDYFPTSFSVENMFQSSIAPDLCFKLASIKGGDDVSLVDLPEYLATHGHREAFYSASRAGKDFFKNISGNSNKTVYYSFIQKGNNYYLSYHFLYAYDPKGTKENTGTGDHVLDRESITIILEDVVDDSSAENFGEPKGIVFGAHLNDQLLKYNGDVELSWKGGRVYVPWSSAKKSGNHPVVPVALGSHALYPLCGRYSIVYLWDIDEDVCGSDLNSTKLLLPESIADALIGDSYNLQDLKLGDLDSYSADAFKALMFSGELIDMIIGGEKFPPFTGGNREIDIENWVSFNVNDPMNKEKAFYWDIAEVDSPLTDAIVEKLDDGIFVDPSTGLMWQDENYRTALSLGGAFDYCDIKTFAGYSNWRLPTKTELLGIYLKKDKLFSYIGWTYWTSTFATNYTFYCKYGAYNGIYVVDFLDGYAYVTSPCSLSRYVRCVRNQ